MDYAGRFAFPVDPAGVWAAMCRLDQFERWWGWLGDLTVEGDGLQEGSVLHGSVSPPVPYRMEVAVHLGRCEPERLIDASVCGDLAGDAHLVLHPAPQGTEVDVWWTLQMLQLPMRMAALVAYPMLRWGHDLVVQATVNGFRRQLAAASAPPRGP
jgi:carbon monoxide dehydrogenase subunit G